LFEEYGNGGQLAARVGIRDGEEMVSSGMEASWENGLKRVAIEGSRTNRCI
jgi:hypothetical protein